MKKVTKLLLVASVAALGAIGFNACGDSITVVEPAPPPPPPPPPPGVQPTIQIASIFQQGGPVNPAAVAGQIDVTLNVEPGEGNTLQKVAILIDGVEVAAQTFTASVQQKGGEGLSTAVAQTQIILSYLTSTLNANGHPVWLNELHQLTASMTTDAGSATAAAVALTFANVNIDGELAVTAGICADDADGDEWCGNGDVEISLVDAVIYSVTPPDIDFTIDICDARWSNDDADQEIEAAVTKTGTEVIWSATIPASIDENQDEQQCHILASALADNDPFDLFLDNVEPDVPEFDHYTFADARADDPFLQGPPNDFANGTTLFGLDGPGVDGGIGTVVFTMNEAVPVGATFGNPATWDVGAVVENGADLGESDDDTAASSFRVVVTALADGLGNTTDPDDLGPDADCLPMCSDAFWVDMTAASFADIRPDGIAVLRPDDGTFGVTPADVITDFGITEELSGLDMDGDCTDGFGNFQACEDETEIDVELDGVNEAFTLAPIPADGDQVDDAAHEISVATVSTDVALEGDWTVDAQFVDQAGNVSTFGTATTTDITQPDVAFTDTEPDFNVPGATTHPADFAGTLEDDNGIEGATITGFVDGFSEEFPAASGLFICGDGTATGTPGAIFVLATADNDINDLGAGPAFTTGYTLKSLGAGVTGDYCYELAASDPSLFLDGTVAGNPSQVTATHTGGW
jgi:hypothetical protein